MFDDKQPAIESFEDLIANLEPIEQSELESDIRANVSAEMKSIRRNISFVLSFLDHTMLPREGDARIAAEAARRECLLISTMVARLQLVQLAHLPQELFMRQTSQLALHYRNMGQALVRLCESATPDGAGYLAAVMQTNG